MDCIAQPDLISLRDLLAPNPDSVARSRDRLHVTQITGAMLARLDPDWQVRFERQGEWDAEGMNRAELGFLWESVLERAIAQRAEQRPFEPHGLLFRPGEVERDGIVGSPDGVMVYPTHQRLAEIKLTWKSAREFAITHRKFLHWGLQVLSYFALLNLTECELYVCHVNGDYSSGYTPKVCSWLVTATEREVEDHWAAMQHEARARGWR